MLWRLALAGLLLTSRTMITSSIGRGPTRTEQIVGRTAALCAHPVIAWHARARWARTRVVAGYFVLGFLAAFAGLLLLA